MDFLSSVWSFLSLVLIAWTTQRIINHREKQKRIEEKKLDIYLSWMPFLAECYERAQSGSPSEPHAYLTKKMEILGTLTIMGPVQAIPLFVIFCEMAQLGFLKHESFDGSTLHRLFAEINGALCCEIHGERHAPIRDLSEMKVAATTATPQSENDT